MDGDLDPERPQRECGPDPLAGFAAVNRSALENQGPITGGTSVTRPQNKTYSNPLNNLRRSAALTSLDFPHSSYKLKPGSRGRGATSIFFRQQRGYGRRIAAGFGFVRSCGRSCPVLRIPLVWVRSFIRESTPRGADTRVGFVFSSSRIRLDFPCELQFGFVFSPCTFSSRGCAIK